MSLPALPRYSRSAYIDPPASIAKRTTAEARGWGKGWPDECPGSAKLAKPVIVRPRDGEIIGRPVRRELAPLFGRVFTYAMLLDPAWELRQRDETHGGQGGVNCRPIKKSNPPKPSNHSSGTAWDANTKGNPMLVGRFADGRLGKAVPFVSRQSPILIRLAAAARIYWGGWYWDRVHRKTGNHYYCDAMHFEYMARPEDVLQSLKDLDAEYERIRAELFPPEEPDVTPEQVKAVQKAMNDLGWLDARGRPLVVDADFGPLTTAAVEGIAARVRANLLDTAINAALNAREETKVQAKAAIDAL